VVEKTLYNSMLSGVSLSADRFFYPNPLESAGQHERSAWFGCACCPSNVCRFLPAIPGYIYAVTKNALYVNLFISNEAVFKIGENKVSVVQESDFPWNGNVGIKLDPEKESNFDLKIRVPGWASNEALAGGLYRYNDNNPGEIKLLLNGSSQKIVIEDGYAVISGKWKKDDRVDIEFPMAVREISADARVHDDVGKIAVQRGPVIYCAEWPDNNDGKILNLVLNKDAGFTTEYDNELLGGTEIIRSKAHQTGKTLDGHIDVLPDEPLLLIPYAFWNNRGAGEMSVWLPVNDSVAKPLPAPTIAYRSKVIASKITKALIAVKDQIEPKSSNDETSRFYHWWPDTNKWEWVQYDFEKVETISKSKVYWFDDGPGGGCRIPDEWKILYSNGGQWKPVSATGLYMITKDEWNTINFKPVKAQTVRIMVKLKKEFSGGIHEWVIE
jgi:hypothetical protein